MSSSVGELSSAMVPGSTAELDAESAGDAVFPLDQGAIQQRALLAFGRRSNAHPSLAVLLQDAAALVEEVLRADHAGVAQVEGDRLRLTILSRDRRGFPLELDRCQGPLDGQQSMVAHALGLGSFVTSENLFEEDRFQDRFLLDRNIVSALVMPLYIHGKPFGAIAAFHGSRRVFSYDDVTFAETVANFLGASIGRIIAEQKLSEAEATQTMIRSELERVRSLTEETASSLGQMAVKLEPVKANPGGDAPTFHPTASVAQGAERRRSARRAYRVRQWIAPLTAGQMPARDDFMEADFYDLSAAGCSFYFKGVPDFKTLVVALGQDSSLIFFAARIARTMPLDDSADTRQLIGCEFTSRLHLPPQYLGEA